MLCGEIASDWIRAKKQEQASAGTSPSLSLGGGLAFEWGFSQHWQLRAAGSLRAAVSRATLVERERDLERIWWNSPFVGGRVGLGAVVAF
jgi:hypothetical protein